MVWLANCAGHLGRPKIVGRHTNFLAGQKVVGWHSNIFWPDKNELAGTQIFLGRHTNIFWLKQQVLANLRGHDWHEGRRHGEVLSHTVHINKDIVHRPSSIHYPHYLCPPLRIRPFHDAAASQAAATLLLLVATTTASASKASSAADRCYRQ